MTQIVLRPNKEEEEEEGRGQMDGWILDQSYREEEREEKRLIRLRVERDFFVFSPGKDDPFWRRRFFRKPMKKYVGDILQNNDCNNLATAEARQ